MSWYEKGISVITKISSITDIKNRALQRLQGGVDDSAQIAFDFAGEMIAENPEFDTMGIAGMVDDPTALANFIQSVEETQIPASPVLPPTPEAPAAPEQVEVTRVEPEGQGAPGPEGQGLDNLGIEDEGLIVNDADLPEEIAGQEYEDIVIPPGEMQIEKGLEVKNPIRQKKFSIPFNKLKTLQSSIKKIADYRDEQGQAPLAVRFMTEDGRPTDKPVPYSKEVTLPGGEVAYYDFVDIILEGEPPNPLGDTVKTIKNLDGSKTRREVIYQIIAFLYLAPKEGFEPKEERFPTYQMAAEHAASQNDPLWVAGKTKKKDAKSGEVFYPSTYRGVWRSIIKPYPNTPTVEDRFKQGNPLDCDHCGLAKRGKSARKKVFVAIEYPAEQLRTHKGERREPTPDEAAAGKQVQIGTKCVSKHENALKFIHNLEKLKVSAINTENLGRESHSFGGAMTAPKSLFQILANYMAAREKYRGRGNWYRRYYGNNLKPTDERKFKSYFFGRKVTQRAKAIAEGKEPEPYPWKGATPESEEKAQELIDWWRTREFDPTIDIGDKEGMKHNNALSVAMHGKVTSKHFDKVMDMVNIYDKVKYKEIRAKEDAERAEQERIRQEEWNAGRAERERVKAEEDTRREEENRQRTEGLGQQGINLVDIATVPQNGEFLSNFKHVESTEWGGYRTRGKGMNHKLVDDRGKTYVIFEWYPKDENRQPIKESKFNFAPGETYVLKGTKGKTSRYKGTENTVLNKAEVVTPGEPAAEPSIAEPSIAEPPIAEPPIAEPPIAEPPVAEPPVAEPPVEAPLEGEELLKKIDTIGRRAKEVVTKGRTRDVTDELGTTTRGREMSPEELIELYLKTMTATWDKFNPEEWRSRLLDGLSQGGKEGLVRQIDFIGTISRHVA